MMNVSKYSQWADTAETLHMVLQMIGKVKLQKMPSQPEWNHVLLYPTARGFTTGLIPGDDVSFDISVNIGSSMVYAHCTDGATAGFPLRNNTSVSDYYSDFRRMLANIGNDTELNTTPQEVAITTPFEQQTEKHDYDCASVADYFETCIFAHNALLEFAAPFRGKKILPALFWGTFDMTTVLFAGEERPFQGDGIIGEVAFDEKFVEFGYWPGDPNIDEPHLFAMPYPFPESDYGDAPVSPKEAYFSPEKKEFFLPLRAVMQHENPHRVVVDFCKDVFAAVSKRESWDNAEWFTKPLLI